MTYISLHCTAVLVLGMLSQSCIANSVTSYAFSDHQRASQRASATSRVHQSFLTSGYGFIENKGQFIDEYGTPRPDVHYMYTGSNAAVQLKRASFSYNLFVLVPDTRVSEAGGSAEDMRPAGAAPRMKRLSETISVRFIGANQHPFIVPNEMAGDYLNYYPSADKNKVCLKVRHFSTVTYKNLYPGIDLRFRIIEPDVDNEKSEPQVKYDFILSPGASPSAIRMEYQGATSVLADGPGSIRIVGRLGEIVESIPLAIGETTGRRFHAAYQVNGQQVGVDCQGYFDDEVNIIDPLVNFSTYLGGSAAEEAKSVAVDGSNNTYIAGWTHSTNAIAAANSSNYIYQSTGGGTQCDGFIVKFNTSGQRLWGTYFGASGYTDDFREIEAYSNGDFAVVGYTDNPNGAASSNSVHQPTNGGTFDALVMRWYSDGSLMWSTYYGGTAWDLAYGLVLLSGGDIIVAGETQSSNAISYGSVYQNTAKGKRDGFVARFAAGGGTLSWGTYYGGSEDDCIYEVCSIETTSDIAIAGKTGSDSPNAEIASSGALQTSRGGSTDAFAARLTSSGARAWGTYYGGNADDEGLDVCSTDAGSILISGKTFSTNFPTCNPYQSVYGGNGDAFCISLSNTGTCQWATYLGGSDDDIGYGVTCNIYDEILLCGETYSTNFPLVNAVTTQFGSYTQMFVSKFSSTYGMIWSTYFGGSTSADNALDVATDGSANVLVTGYTFSSNYPVYNAHQSTFGQGGRDAVLSCLRDPHIETVIAGQSFRASENIQVAVNVSYGPLNSGNTYVIELSDHTGDFTSPTVIGQGAGTGSTTVTAILPSRIARGSDYRIRTRATNPATTGYDNGSALTIYGSYEWTGATDGSWTTSSNWTPQYVPTTNDDVYIPTTTTPLSYIPAPLHLYTLKLNTSAGTAVSGGYLTINHELTLQNGILTLRGPIGSSVLVISAGSQISGGSASSYIIAGSHISNQPTGYVKYDNIGSTPVTIPLGTSSAYTPITIINDGVTDNYNFWVMPSFAVNGGPGYPGGSQITSDVVALMWVISESTLGGSDLTLTMQWNSANETTGFSNTDCFVVYSDCVSWQQRTLRSTAAGSGPFTLTVSDVTEFTSACRYPPQGTFAIADPGASLGFGVPFAGGVGSGYDMDESVPGPVPVELSTFSVREKNGVAYLQWRTETELNNYGFEIQRTYRREIDSWSSVGYVEGAGTSQIPRIYCYEDRPDEADRIWYRLKQIDRNGTHEYSPVVCLERGANPSQLKIIGIYPHPVRDNAILEMMLQKDVQLEVQLCNMLGETVRVLLDDQFIEKGRHVVPIRLIGLPAGTYLMRVLTADRVLNEVLQVM